MNRMSIRIALCLTAVATVSLDAVTLTEKAALLRALEANTDIRLNRISIKSDSLGQELVEAGWLPHVTLSGSVQFDTVPSPQCGNSAGVSISQAVPGGGIATFYAGRDVAVDDLEHCRASNYTDCYAVSYKQPLLKDAWKHASQEYAVKVGRLDHAELTVARKKDIITGLSAVRSLYWSCYEKKALLAIARNAAAYFRLRQEAECGAYRLGESTELDTLSAALDRLQAEKELIAAENAEQRARTALAAELMLADDALDLSDDGEVTVDDLPAAETLITMVKEYDPQLKMYGLARRRLHCEYADMKNGLLPDLSLNAGYTNTSYKDRTVSDDTYASDNVMVSLVLSYALPVRSRRIGLLRKECDRETCELECAGYLAELENSVADLIRSWEQEKLMLAIVKRSRDVAGRKLDAARKGYEIGIVDRLNLEKAESDFARIATGYVQALITLKKIEIVFDEMTGNILGKFDVKL